jgi:hypothetical protein
MTSRSFVRLIVATAILALVAVVLFNGSITHAGKADRTAPTTPTGLALTAITARTVTLKWNPATDNSGKVSYRIKVNIPGSSYSSVATVTQTGTTYTVQFLIPRTNYTFSAYAVDPSGNRSGDSNLVSAATPAEDTTPPSAPVLQAVAIGPSQVQLTWTKPTDSGGGYCCSWSFTRNGSPLTQHINNAAAPVGSRSVIIRHLPPDTNNTFTVIAIDTERNSSTSNAASAQTWPSSDRTPPSVPTNLRLVTDNGGGEVWIGWTQAFDETDTQGNVEYEIYVNGVLSPLPVSAGVDVDFVYTLPVCENIFTVKAVDKSGNTSAASAPLKFNQWVCN